MKSYCLSMSIVMWASICTAAPYVTNVVAKTRLPWNGLVDVSYEIVGSTNGLECVYGQLSATDRTRGKTYVASTFEKKIDLAEGKHTATWNMAADNSFTSKDVVFNMSIRTPALYCVIDLSGGPDATSYPVSDLDDVPAGGWTDEYKTTKLVLRRINPGTFIMGEDQTDESHRVWITKLYYIGVFEMTQKQYVLIMGYNPSSYKGDMRPVESINWNRIRGESDVYNWPIVEDVDSGTVMGKLRSKTGMRFDLPTEAQWEYACRAGTASRFNNGGDSEDDLKLLGRYRNNGGYESNHTIVGSYGQNNWGLYDMHGNVYEWCLDWRGGIFYGVDPVGDSLLAENAVNRERVLRGGGSNSHAEYCTSYHLDEGYPDGNYVVGFRIACSAREN